MSTVSAKADRPCIPSPRRAVDGEGVHGDFHTPVIDRDQTDLALSRLVVRGAIADSDLERRINRLDERFRTYVDTYPYGLWGAGLDVTAEMRGMTEVYLPMGEIGSAFGRFFALSLRFPPFLAASPFHRSNSWLDAVERLDPPFRMVSPGRLLRRLAADEAFRICFLFSLFLPPRYGGRFNRYPLQSAFLQGWLGENRGHFAGKLRCLDAACGSGEGTYGFALLALDSGYEPSSFTVHGTTVEPIELFAAIHGYFPHDRQREAGFRQRIVTLGRAGVLEQIAFSLEDIMHLTGKAEYMVVLCNGMLGGPFIHDEGKLEMAIRGLAARLKPGGVLLAADRFHDGWKKIVPSSVLEEMFARNGLRPLAIGEGVAGVRA